MNGLPGIVKAARAATVLEAALMYEAYGFSVIPVIGKRSSVEWTSRQEQPAAPCKIKAWHGANLLQGVGIVCGKVSGNLVVIDLDGMDAVQAFMRRFPGLFYTYTVTSGSGSGRHLYFRVDKLPPTTRVTGIAAGNIELRANGCYVVAPPSVHPNGNKYVVSNPLAIRRLADMDHVVTWIKSLIAEKHGGVMPPPANAPREPLNVAFIPHGVRNPDAWAKAALNRECEAVASAREGQRNTTLYRAAFKLGQLVSVGLLTRGDVERCLLSAARVLSASDGETATMKTITSGIEAAAKQPVWRSQDAG